MLSQSLSDCQRKVKIEENERKGKLEVLIFYVVQARACPQTNLIIFILFCTKIPNKDPHVYKPNIRVQDKVTNQAGIIYN